MRTVDLLEAKSNLSELVRAIETGEQAEIVITRDGVPAARLVQVITKRKIVLGIAQGKYVIPDDFDGDNELIAEMFGIREPK